MSKDKKKSNLSPAQLLRGISAGTVITGSTFLHGPPVLLAGLVQTLLPASRMDQVAIKLTNSWLGVNNWLIDHLLPNTEWHLTVPTNLDMNGQYLLMCNHQTWLDTTVMQYIGLTRLPLTRFFTKWELIFIPFLGLAFKILGFPMMRRHSKEAIAKNPALKQQDLEEAKRACNGLKSVPYTLLNYLEGTRFTPEKQKAQKSPFKHLLKPKSGGIGLALYILGKDVDGLIDMTIVYPDGVPTYSDFWLGRVRRIGVDLREIPIPDWVLQGSYEEDEAFREKFQLWIGELWHNKDQLIEQMLQKFAGKDTALSPDIPSLSNAS